MKNYNTVPNNLSLTVRKEYRLTVIKHVVERTVILSSKVCFSTFVLIVLNIVF